MISKRIITCCIRLGCFFALPAFLPAVYAANANDSIRIVSRSITVKHDSVHFDMDIHLGNVQVSTSDAFILVPVIRTHKKTLDLPAVIVAGRNRNAFNIREDHMDSEGKKRDVYAYLQYRRKNKEELENVHYKVSIPFASWMPQAELALKQLSKDCCNEKLLSVTCLDENINLKHACFTCDDEYYTPAYIHPRYALYADMVSFLPADLPSNEARNLSADLYIDYRRGLSAIDPGYGNNLAELEKADSLLMPLLDQNRIAIRSVRLTGYASPDGNYLDNEALAKSRTLRFKDYLQQVYGLPGNSIRAAWIAEDWDGALLLLKNSDKPYKAAAIDIIYRYGIFEGREKQLMDLQGGAPYKDILQTIFPALRRIELTVEYTIKGNKERAASSDTEIAGLLYTHPEKLTLAEIFSVARFYRPGTEQYREVYEIAAHQYPGDPTANINAAAAVLLLGDTKTAWQYLKKVETDPRAFINLGVLCLMEGNPQGAENYFRKAIGVNPRLARQNLSRIRQER